MSIETSALIAPYNPEIDAPADIAAAHLLVRQDQVLRGTNTFSDITDTQDDLTRLPETYLADGGEFLVARSPYGELAGFVGLRNMGNGEVQLKRLSVLPEHQGQKIGPALVQELIRLAREKGYVKISLQTGGEEEAREKVYLPAGFVDTGRMPKEHKTDEYLMELDLNHTQREAEPTNRIDWSLIEDHIQGATKINTGFSAAFKGIVSLPGGEEMFVKVGTDAKTNAYTAKEVAVYQLLEEHGYPYAPKLVSVSNTGTGFALEALTAEQGWEWPTWTEPELTKALEAMDALAEVPLTDAQRVALRATRSLSEVNGGWHTLAESTDKQEAVRKKLAIAGHESFASMIDFDAMADWEAGFSFDQGRLVHYDVRSYNCAWNEAQEAVKLVDFDWAMPGDQRIAFAMCLGDAHSLGLDVRKQHLSKLDPEALTWAAGYWLKGTLKPNIDPVDCDFKIARGIAALSLAREIQ